MQNEYWMVRAHHPSNQLFLFLSLHRTNAGKFIQPNIIIQWVPLYFVIMLAVFRCQNVMYKLSGLIVWCVIDT